ncbi:GNAT family N-acetyltransferase [Ectobacillus ponti]|uniref:GNAT family N-acetyltransferase n=1 Tax=Ectobacillus ponti TaxID=2961894 RepID=A0AA41XBL8_9BACI|nr:GNAT family protein [Ectobacillus ponti]MCP8969975.1 GNAT family N-acetyltransferase [Ectobacillus ponti]
MRLFQAIPRLETERFLLRGMESDDAPAVLANLSDPDVTRDMGVQAFASIEEAEGLIRFMNDLFAKGIAFRWGIVRKEDNQLVGTCGYNGWETNRGSRVEIAYDLGKPYWRKGYMTEIMEALLAYSFEEAAFYRVEAFTNPDAVPSMKLLESVGFQKDGVLRGYASAGDGYIDQCCFSLLRGDWLAQRKGEAE